jgi:hypothetical protein
MHNNHGRHASRETVTTRINPQTGASLATNLARLFSNNMIECQFSVVAVGSGGVLLVCSRWASCLLATKALSAIRTAPPTGRGFAESDGR